ncbi:unnamed protein product [Calypogeia fissa]
MEEPEENDPNSVLPHMLFDQESHDLICPMCEHTVTGEVILQKRKREFEGDKSVKMPHGIQARLRMDDALSGLSMSVTKEGFVEDTSEEDEAEVQNALQEQTNYELLCPDCESCITHEVILQKRKRATSTSDSLPRKKFWIHPQHELHPGTRTGGGMGKLDDSDEEDPPLKRHTRSQKGKAVDTDSVEARVVRLTLQNQKNDDLSCSDCASRITYQVILKPRTNASGKPVGLLEKRGRRRRKFVTSVDDNPWKTRYKRAHGHSKPIAVAEAAKRKKREEAQSRVANYGPIENKSLAEPLLPVQQDDAGDEVPTTIDGRYRYLRRKFEDIFGPCAITYFLVMIFLYCIYFLLRVV